MGALGDSRRGSCGDLCHARSGVGNREKGQLLLCSGREEADARVESWKYDPWVLAENGVVDRCSLYLSLRKSGDERMQKEIGLLIERLRI